MPKFGNIAIKMNIPYSVRRSIRQQTALFPGKWPCRPQDNRDQRYMRFFSLPRPAFLVACTIALTVIAAVLVLGKGLGDADGYLTRDSSSYLELAENLIAGNGVTVLNTGAGVAASERFATWPIGYPGFIALVSGITGVSTFLASKLINIGFLVLAVLAVVRGFGRDGPILALLLLTGGTLEIFAFSWSEAPFIALMVLFALALARVMPSGAPLKAGQLFWLCLLAFALFLTRYIGLFALAPLLVVALLKLRNHDLRPALLLAGTAGVAGALALAYLLYNSAATGHATGIPRPAAMETHADLLSALGIALVRELVLPIPYWVATDIKHNAILGLVLIFILALTVLAARMPSEDPAPATRARAQAFLLVGGFYLASMIALRWISFFDPFGYRLLGPGTVIVLIGIFAGLLAYRPSLRAPVFLGLLGMVALSLVVHAMMLRSNTVPGGYAAGVDTRAAAYVDLPPGAIVLYGLRHLRYQRADVHLFNPNRHSDMGEDDPIDVLMAELDPSRPVYLELGRWALEAEETAPSQALRDFITTCERESYLHQIVQEAGIWKCIALSKSP